MGYCQSFAVIVSNRTARAKWRDVFGPSQCLAAQVPLATKVKCTLEAIGNGSAVQLVSFNASVTKAPPEILCCATREMIGIDQQAVMVLWNFGESEARVSVHFICSKPSQRTPLQPLKRICPLQKGSVAPFPTPPSWVSQGEVVRHVLRLKKSRSLCNEGLSASH
jgi:hypothetical protein